MFVCAHVPFASLLTPSVVPPHLSFAVKYKHRVDEKQILPAVAWKEAGSATGKTLKAKAKANN